MLLNYGADPNALYNNCTTLGRLKWMYEIDNWEEYLAKGEEFAPVIKLIMSYGGKAECSCEDMTSKSSAQQPE
jgi:hypothetical protein